ncbi:MAG: O-antigen ligase family protein [Lachnospiraceae bacterium]|nr:O-antigen ligase family protein [Lachnospiraceae bacterium]
MEGKGTGSGIADVRACLKKIREETGAKDIINTSVLLIMFTGYTLTFFVPRFYGLTEKYVGLFVFLMLSVLFAVNVNIREKIRTADKDLIALILLVLATGINILIVRSGFGCFFVAASFAMIFYLSGEMPFRKWQVYLFGALYTAMVIYWFFGVYTWMFADYSSFAMNTNTAATFTVYSMLGVFVFLEALMEKHPIAGLAVTAALIKCLQISLYHRSRGAFIMLLVFFILRFIIPKKLWEKKGFFMTACCLAIFGSLAFVAFYVWLSATGVNFRMPFFYKNIFSGREAIWLEFWELFRKKPLTGIGTNVTITSFFEFNVHNAMYNILVIHGVIVFGLTVFLMLRRWNGIRKGISRNRVRLCAFLAVLAVCFESYFDVDLIWTDYSVNLFFLLHVANVREGEERDGS